MHLDIFNNDAFNVSQLTLAMNESIPREPGRLGELGLFREEPLTTTSLSIESIGTTIALVQTSPRGAPALAVGNDKRKLRSFNTVRLAREWAVYADEVQNLRAFGSETDVETVQNLVNRKLALIKRNIDATHEWQRMGALKGQVLDADGSVLLDCFTDFGVSQITFSLGLANPATDIKQKCVDLKRLIKSELGGLRGRGGVRAMLAPDLFDDFVAHAKVDAAFDRWMDGQFKRTTQNEDGFYFGEIFWEENDDAVGATPFVEAGAGYAWAQGVSDQFISYFAPADYLETVNTTGLPYYAKQWMMQNGKGVQGEGQSNPLHLNTRPRAVVKITA
jgi:hypothetical protein